MNLLQLVLALLVLALVPRDAPAQEIDSTVPVEAVRRLVQAIWPRDLFDLQGRPERAIDRRPFEPSFSDLRLRRATRPVRGLPDVQWYVATAYPGDCNHCGLRVAAVAQRGDEFVTLTEPQQLHELVSWISPRMSAPDAEALRDFVIDALVASCLLMCAEVAQVRSEADLLRGERMLLHPTRGTGEGWVFPETVSSTRGCSHSQAFVLRAPYQALYRITIQAEWCQTRFTFIDVNRLARIGITP